MPPFHREASTPLAALLGEAQGAPVAVVGGRGVYVRALAHGAQAHIGFLHVVTHIVGEFAQRRVAFALLEFAQQEVGEVPWFSCG